MGVALGEALTLGEGCDSGAVTLGKGAALGEGVTSRAVTLRQKGLSGGVAGSPGRDDPWGVALREGVTLGGG